MKLQPISVPSRNAAVLEALASYVAEARLAPGDKLPTERDLTDQLQVGRSTVREAIKAWEALGIVETRKGSGTFLRRPVAPGAVHRPLTLTLLKRRETLLHTLEIRRALEAEASVVAAVKAGKSDLEVMEQRLVAMEKVHRAHGTAGPEDWEFHLSIYDATRNPMFGEIVGFMREQLFSFFKMAPDWKGFAARSFPLHRELFEAIAQHDPERARNLTLGILKITEEDIRTLTGDG